MSDETCCGACGYPIHATKDKACGWCRQAADRIEALTKDLAAWKKQHAVEALGWHNQIVRADKLEAKLATCEKYRDAYADCDRIGTQAVRDLEVKLALVTVAYRLEAMRRDDYSHEDFEHHLAEIKGDKP